MGIYSPRDDFREPSLRAHEEAMRMGSQALLKTLWREHGRIMRCLTGKLVGPS